MGSRRTSYSNVAWDYKLLEEVGQGPFSTVYRAVYLPLNKIVAIKCLDLDRCSINLDDVRKTAQTICSIDHPNLVKIYCVFVVEKALWVVMQFMAEGSCLHLMRIACSEGFEESTVSSLLKEILKALDYLHRHGHIHCSLKAANILVDSNGVVKLVDFGVSAGLFDVAEKQRFHNAAVESSCWFAPEIFGPGSVCDLKADIWSFGITALELTHGPAPFSKYPPKKLLLMMRNVSARLTNGQAKRLSKSFRDMVALCLLKDQTKRPTAENLLQHSFFRCTKSADVCFKHILADLPLLYDRVKALQLKDAALVAMKRMPFAEQEAFSQRSYNSAINAWKLDIEDLKALASEDDDAGNSEGNMNAKQNQQASKAILEKSVSMNDLSRRLTPEKSRRNGRNVPNLSGPLNLPTRASANSLSAPIKTSGGFKETGDDKSKTAAVQVKGRFSITSGSKQPTVVSPIRKSASVGDGLLESKQLILQQSKEGGAGGVLVSTITAHLQNLIQQTAFQQDLIMNFLNMWQQTHETDGKAPDLACTSESGVLEEGTPSEREQLLLVRIAELQARLSGLMDEVLAAKLKQMQLQQRLNVLEGNDNDGCTKGEDFRHGSQ